MNSNKSKMWFAIRVIGVQRSVDKQHRFLISNVIEAKVYRRVDGISNLIYQKIMQKGG
jgi:hypothetical protein